jgi:hypothetical protein
MHPVRFPVLYKDIKEPNDNQFFFIHEHDTVHDFLFQATNGE